MSSSDDSLLERNRRPGRTHCPSEVGGHRGREHCGVGKLELALRDNNGLARIRSESEIPARSVGQTLDRDDASARRPTGVPPPLCDPWLPTQ